MRILLIPLDDRPPSRVFPQCLAEIAGVDLQVAPRNLLGRFLQPGDCRALAEWMLSEVMDAEVVIVSADMLCYGGLVASRVPNVDRPEALRQVRVLKRLKQMNPGVKVFCSSTLTRLTITSSDPYRQKWSPRIFAYSQRLEAARHGDQAAIKDCAALRKEIPEDLLQPYLEARQRNLEVSKHLVRLTADNFIDYLALTQEDCAVEGIHRIEQTELSRLIADRGVHERVILYPGADEAAITLLARAITTMDGSRPIEVVPHYWPPTFAKHVPPYEDRPHELSLAAHLRASGCHRVSLAHNTKTVSAATQTSEKQVVQLAIWGGGDTDSPEHSAQHFVSWLREMISGGQPVAIADLAHPNGADDVLLHELSQTGPGILGRLSSFAGWNTASNSLGTVIAHIVCLNRTMNAGALYPLAHYRFLFERFVDDWAYQSEVRSEINAELKQRGLFAGNLGSAAPGVEAEIRQRLLPLAIQLFDTQFKGIVCHEGTLTGLQSLEVKLPWPRTFEVELSGTLGVSATAPELPAVLRISAAAS